VVNWNRQPRATTYVSAHELQALILASDITVNTAGMITVTTASPNGPISSSTYFQVEVHESRATMGSIQEYIYPNFPSCPGSVADLSNDNSLDIVGVRGGSGFSYTIGTLMNNGAGSFYAGPSLTNKEYPYAPCATFGDFNGDGNIDFLYVAGQSRQVTPLHLGVSLNNGNGTFSVGQTFGSFTTSPGANGEPIVPDFVVGDFNQDGTLDVATSDCCTQSMELFWGNGDGTFSQPTTAFIGRGTGNLLVGDFNGDGKLDVIGAAISGEDTYWEIKFLAGNGDGTFQSPQTIGVFPYVPFFSPTFFINDFNKDGKLDIAFGNPFGQIGIMLGNGDGTFQSPIFYNVGDQTYFTFVVGDFNNDGNTDIVVQQNALTNTGFSILLGNGDGTFQSPQVLLQGGLFPGGVFMAADFNNDGLLDLSVPAYDYYVFLQQ